MHMRPRASRHLPHNFVRRPIPSRPSSHFGTVSLAVRNPETRRISPLGSSIHNPNSSKSAIWPAEDNLLTAKPAQGGIVEDPISAVSLRALYPTWDTYGKWEGLLWDVEQLERESNVGEVASGHLLVDQTGNEDDIALWSCILNFTHRRNGAAGVLNIWKAVSARRCLYNTSQSLGAYFWGTILESVGTDERLLESIHSYAVWLHQTHHVEWPFLYQRIVSGFLSIGQFQKALRWHLRICATLEPGTSEIEAVLRNFILDSDQDMQSALQSIYITSTCRQSHDTLLSHLLDANELAMSCSWQAMLANQGDVYLSCRSEVALDQQQDSTKTSTPTALTEIYPARINHPADATPYNDALGARWFATSWVSIDFALKGIHTLGVREIGPLSLQSICLREPDPAAISVRLDQLASYGIGLGSSAFSRAVHLFSKNRLDGSLQRLLASDLHPDVYDDFEAQIDVLADASSVGWWERHQVLAAVRLALNEVKVHPSNDPRFNLAMELEADHAVSLDLGGGIAKGYTAHDEIRANHDRALTLLQHPLSADQLPCDVLSSYLSKLAWKGKQSKLEDFFFELMRIRHAVDSTTAWPQFSKIWTSSLQDSIARSAFHWEFRVHTRNLSPLGGRRSGLEKLGPARGIGLLRMLKDQGVAIDLGNMRRAVYKGLAHIDAEKVGDDDVAPARRLATSDTLKLIEDAWGGAEPVIDLNGMGQMSRAESCFVGAGI